MAVARGSCLYCGAPLDSEQVAVATAAVQSLAAPAAAPPPERHIVLLDVRAASREALSAALGLPAFDAEQRLRRGGYQLHRIAEPGPAGQEAERLRGGGLTALVVPEADARVAADPHLALGGDWDEGTLTLRTGEGARGVAGRDLLLMVRGPIARALEEPPQEQFRRVRLAGPGEGHRIHLHLRDEPRPFELDPDDFEMGAAAHAGAALATLLGWLRELARAVPVDDGFRHFTPALGPAQPPLAGAAGAAQALSPARAGKGARPALFDNVAQFRFYSGWRAAVERRGAC